MYSIIRNSPELQKALSSHRGTAQATAAVIANQLSILEGSILDLDRQLTDKAVDLRLAFGGLKDGQIEQNPDYLKIREDNLNEQIRLTNKKQDIKDTIAVLVKKRCDLEQARIRHKDINPQAERVLELIQAKGSFFLMPDVRK